MLNWKKLCFLSFNICFLFISSNFELDDEMNYFKYPAKKIFLINIIIEGYYVVL
jgi:hypothetical protein